MMKEGNSQLDPAGFAAPSAGLGRLKFPPPNKLVDAGVGFIVVVGVVAPAFVFVVPPKRLVGAAVVVEPPLKVAPPNRFPPVPVPAAGAAPNRLPPAGFAAWLLNKAFKTE